MSFSDDHTDQQDALGWLEACLTLLVPTALITITLMAICLTVVSRLLW